MEMDPGVLMSLLNDDKGFMGSEFIWIILFFFLFGFGGNGFGNRGGLGEGASALVDMQAAVKAANSDQNMTNMLFSAIEGNGQAIQGLGQYLGVQSDTIQGAIRQVGQGICDLGYKMGMDTRDVIQQIASGDASIRAELAQCCCTTNRNIDSVKYDMAMMNTGIINAIDKCCCQTQLGLKDLGYQSATQACSIEHAIQDGFCGLNNSMTTQLTQLNYNQQQGFQSIINYMNTQETDRLRTDLQAAQLQISQVNQTLNLENFIRQNCGGCTSSPAAASYLK